MTRLSETNGIVYVFKPGDHAAGVTGESINTEGCDHVTYILQCATFTDNGGAGADLTIKSGASDAAETTAETFHYRIASAAQAAASADVYGTETDATTLELLKASVDSKVVVLEVPVDSLSSGQPWLTLALNNHGTAANCSCIAVLSGCRYQPPPTALA